MKILQLLFALSFIFINGCINEDFEDTISNTAIYPEYSIPLGFAEYSLNKDVFFGTGSGSQGITYFDDIPYPENQLYYERGEVETKFPINFSELTDKNIVSIMFRINVFNSFPTDIESQVYINDNEGNLIDSLFKPYPFIVMGGQTNTSGKVIKENTQIKNIDYKQQMHILKQANSYTVVSKIYTKKQGLDDVRFYSTSRIKIILGARILMKFNADEAK